MLRGRRTTQNPSESESESTHPLRQQVVGGLIAGLIAGLVVGLALFYLDREATKSDTRHEESVVWRNQIGGSDSTPGAVLDSLDLSGLHASDKVLREMSARSANLDDAYFVLSDLSGADFTSASLRGADLSRATARGARFDGADLRGAVLTRTSLVEAVLTDADLRGATLWRADLRNADLSGALIDADSLHGACWSDQTTLPVEVDSLESMCAGELDRPFDPGVQFSVNTTIRPGFWSGEVSTTQTRVNAAPGETVTLVVEVTNVGSTDLDEIIVFVQEAPYLQVVPTSPILYNDSDWRGTPAPQAYQSGSIHQDTGAYPGGSKGYLLVDYEVTSDPPSCEPFNVRLVAYAFNEVGTVNESVMVHVDPGGSCQ